MDDRSHKPFAMALLLAAVAGISAAQSPATNPAAGNLSGAGRDPQPLRQPAARSLAQQGYVWNKSRP